MFWSVIYFFAIIPTIFIMWITYEEIETKKDEKQTNLFFMAVIAANIWISLWMIFSLIMLFVSIFQDHDFSFNALSIILTLLFLKLVNMLLFAYKRKKPFNKEGITFFSSKTQKIIFSILFVIPFLDIVWIIIIWLKIKKQENKLVEIEL